jgi:hypothetical protein
LGNALITSQNKLDTSYILVDSSAHFPSQAHRVILYQWLGIRQARGVPKEHVLAWAEFIDDVTVQAPRPSSTGPCAEVRAPEEWIA